MNTAGVGLDSRKGVLLFDPAGSYGVQMGAIDASGLSPGTYEITLVPLDCSVMQADIDLGQPSAGSVLMQLPETSIQGSSITVAVTEAPLQNEPPVAVSFCGAGLSEAAVMCRAWVCCAHAKSEMVRTLAAATDP